MKLKSILLAAALGMLLAGPLLRAYSMDATQQGSNIIQNKNDMAKDAVALQGDVIDHKEDNADIKQDRQALRDAIQSKDQDKIQQVNDKLHKDLISAGKGKKTEKKKPHASKFKKHHGKSEHRPGMLD